MMERFEVVESRHDVPVIGQQSWEKAARHESWWNTTRTDRDLVVERVSSGYLAEYWSTELGIHGTLEEAQKAAEQTQRTAL